MSITPASRVIYSVSRLNREARELLDGSFPPLWVEGEVSNFRAPSAHWYFTLKDEQAQVRCAMFRNRNYLIAAPPKNGDKVLLRVRVTLYEASGEYQLVAEHLEPAGLGALQRAFEELKRKLQTEGLFDAAHKQALPPLPRCIGIITSPTGAAIRDILTTLRRRYPLGSVVLYPVPVQGTEAAPAIVRAIQAACERGECDVLILTRGGGSLEDLFAFNDERLARAIHACAIPLVSAVGHEIDFTIADFVADLRAATPTAAAELVTPDAAEWRKRLDWLTTSLPQLQARRRTALADRLARLQQRLAAQHPGRRLNARMQRLDEVTQRLRQAAERLLERRRTGLAALARALDALSPLQTLQRGYAIATVDGHVLTDAARAQLGRTLKVQLRRGRVDASIVAVAPDTAIPLIDET